MIKIDMTTENIDRQVLLLQEYPEIARRHFLPAVKRATLILSAYIRPTIPSPGRFGTGRARSDFQTKVTGTTIQNIQGRVGFSKAWWMNVVEHGARRHPLQAKSTIRTRSGANAFSVYERQYGQFKTPVLIKGVGWRKMAIHPGFGGRHFMQAGADRGAPQVTAELAKANEAVARELIA